MLWGVLAENCSVFQNFVFLDFRLIEPVFRPIENAIKILVWTWLFQSLLDWFDRSNLIFDRSKIVFLTCSSLFKTFQTLFSFSSISLRVKEIFCRFPPNLLQGFCLHTPEDLSTLPFAFIFMFHALNHAFWENFEPNLEGTKI